eukprot:5311872-Prymnesium_polylepis.2
MPSAFRCGERGARRWRLAARVGVMLCLVCRACTPAQSLALRELWVSVTESDEYCAQQREYGGSGRVGTGRRLVLSVIGNPHARRCANAATSQ